MKSKIILAVSMAALLGGCALQRQHELQDRVDAAYAQCQAGEPGACDRYKLALKQYQVEMSQPRCGLLGIPCGPAIGVVVN